MKHKIILLMGLVLLVLLSGCANHVNVPISSLPKLVGFWHGLWHGLILPVSFLVSLFDPSCAVYAIYNNGGWYNFGFLIGTGGLALSYKSTK